MGLGAYPATDKQFLGMLGMHGTYEANLAMHDADLIVAVGARFDDRITGRLDAFAPNSEKIHIDIDPSSINKNVAVDLPIVGDVGSVLAQMLRVWKDKEFKTNAKTMKAWWSQINDWRTMDCLKYDQSGSVIKPQFAIERLYENTKDMDCYITTEVGQHQMWAAQFYKFNEPNRWMTSGGLGTMGYGLPSAIGVQVAHPESLVVDISGEASFLMNMQEMSTAVQYRAPVKVFITNNQYMGMVRQWQELLHGGRYAESYTDALPDLVKLAEACQWVGLRANRQDEVDDVIQEMIEIDRPVIADIWVDQTENCFPMIPSGAAQTRCCSARKTRHQNLSLKKAWCWSSASGNGAGVTQDDGAENVVVDDTIERHTIAVLVDNEAGVLARVIGLFSGRGYNIESLTVAETDADEGISRITIVTSGTPMIIEQIKAQLDRLVPVHRVVDLTTEGASVERELALVKVAGKDNKRVEALRIADIFRARAIDSTNESFVFEISGATEKLSAFVELMEPLGLVDVSRTGVVAIARGKSAL